MNTNSVFSSEENLSTTLISSWKIVSMRILYLITFLGVGIQSWAEVINPDELFGTLDGVSYSFWIAYASLMGLGIRYPIRMLPLIFLQFFYKAVWVAGIYYPMWASNQLDSSAASFLNICFIAMALDVIAIPWRFVYHHYLKHFLKINRYHLAK